MRSHRCPQGKPAQSCHPSGDTRHRPRSLPELSHNPKTAANPGNAIPAPGPNSFSRSSAVRCSRILRNARRAQPRWRRGHRPAHRWFVPSGDPAPLLAREIFQLWRRPSAGVCLAAEQNRLSVLRPGQSPAVPGLLPEGCLCSSRSAPARPGRVPCPLSWPRGSCPLLLSPALSPLLLFPALFSQLLSPALSPALVPAAPVPSAPVPCSCLLPCPRGSCPLPCPLPVPSAPVPCPVPSPVPSPCPRGFCPLGSCPLPCLRGSCPLLLSPLPCPVPSPLGSRPCGSCPLPCLLSCPLLLSPVLSPAPSPRPLSRGVTLGP